MTTIGKMLNTLGNLLMLTGLYVLLFVGGLFADEQYNVYAASGANDAGNAAVLDPGHRCPGVAHTPVVGSKGRQYKLSHPYPSGALRTR